MKVGERYAGYNAIIEIIILPLPKEEFAKVYVLQGASPFLAGKIAKAYFPYNWKLLPNQDRMGC